MDSYTLTAAQITALNNALLEIPGKYGFPVIQLVNRFLAEQSKPQVVETEREAVNE